MIKDTVKIWKNNKARAFRESGATPVKQLFSLLYWRLHGFNAREYYSYPLYAVDPRPVITTRQYDFAQRHLNPPKQGVVAVDKWIQSAIWKANGIAHPETLGYVKDGRGVLGSAAFNGNSHQLHDFLSSQFLPLVIKPLDGANGEGFDIISSYDADSGMVNLASSGEQTLEDFFSSSLQNTYGVLFQQKISQHPELDKIFSKAVNTVRLITCRLKDGSYEVLQAIAKFGGGDSLIDNELYSGVLANVGLSSGALGIGQRRMGVEQFACHPDTGAPIQGVILPFWNETMSLAIRAHQLLPSPGHLGWDIAISAAGPMVVEMNSYLSIAVNQKVQGTKAQGIVE